MTIQIIKVSLKTERIQCNATRAITGAIKRTFQNKLYSKSGFKSQKSRYWFRKHFLKKSWNTWCYLLTLFPQTSHLYNYWLSEDVTTFYNRINAFKYSFFPSTLWELNNFVRKILQSTTMVSFRNSRLFY